MRQQASEKLTQAVRIFVSAVALWEIANQFGYRPPETQIGALLIVAGTMHYFMNILDLSPTRTAAEVLGVFAPSPGVLRATTETDPVSHPLPGASLH